MKSLPPILKREPLFAVNAILTVVSSYVIIQETNLVLSIFPTSPQSD